METGTRDDPWRLTTPPGTSGYTRHARSRTCTPGCSSATTGSRSAPPTRRSRPPTAPSKRGAGPQTTRSAVGTACNGYRGRFGMYLPPLLEHLGLAEYTHDARNNRIRALRATT